MSIVLQVVLTTIYIMFMWSWHNNYKEPKELIRIMYENGSTNHWAEGKVRAGIKILAVLSTLMYVLLMLILGMF